MSSSSSKSSLDSGRRPPTGPGIGGNGGTVMPPPLDAWLGRAGTAAGTGLLARGAGCGTDGELAVCGTMRRSPADWCTAGEVTGRR